MTIEEALSEKTQEIKVAFPNDRMDLVNLAYAQSQVTTPPKASALKPFCPGIILKAAR